jgi:cell division septation protein DedD
MKQPFTSVTSAKRSSSILTGSLLVVMIGVGVLGAQHLGSSSAATATYSHDAFGNADYCVLEGSNTVLYGWAHDPDAPAGAQPNVTVKVGATTTTVNSSVSGYRDAAINDYISRYYPGMPTSSVYGWRVSLSGLYKGGSYAVSGTVLNYGTGANGVLAINTGTQIAGSHFTASKTVPDACLATKPIVPTPAPIPTPTPTPAPSTPKPTTPTKSTTKTTTPAAPASTTVSNAADATPTVGTIVVSLKVPAGSASSLHVMYGSDAANLDQTTSDTPTNGNDVTVLLTGLNAKSSYSYQIVRVLGAQTVTSPAASFTTSGYNLTLVFKDGKGMPVAGITGELLGKKAKSDSHGELTFKDLAAGNYSPTFQYKGHTYAQSADTSTIIATNNPTIASLENDVNVDDLQTTAAVKSAPTKKGSSAPAIIISIILVLAIIGAGVWFWLRRQRADQAEAAYIPMPTPATPAIGSDIIDQQSHQHFSKKTPAAEEPAPENMGKSLKEMVIESIRAENAKRKDQQPPKDPPA